MSDDGSGPRDEARPEDAAIAHPEASDEAEESFHPFDELDDDYQPGPARYVVGQDGGPVRIDQTTSSDIPPLSTETLVCMGDFSSFVIREDELGTTIASVEASHVERAPNGKWVAKAKHVKLLVPSCPMPASPEDWVDVEPIRPPCKHYVRQKTQLEQNAQVKAFVRLCSARRTTEGTFMTVRDTGLWACDMRDPYDRATAQQLDDFDRLKIEEGARREHTPLGSGYGIFDVSK